MMDEKDRSWLIGRRTELESLDRRLGDAVRRKGSFTLVSGEAGIGKSTIVGRLKRMAVDRGMDVLTGHSSSDSSKPYMAFVEALEGHADTSFFSDEEAAGFGFLIAMDVSGTVLASSSGASDGGTSSTLSDTLMAVQEFVKDSFSQREPAASSLGRLEYGDMKIIIEHGLNVSLAAVFNGSEHPGMRARVKQSMEQMDGPTTGHAEANRSIIKEMLDKLADARFSVKKDLEGIKLDNERMKIAGKVAAALAELAAGRGAILVLEDLHWADESSLSILPYIARNVSGSTLAIVATSRPGYCDILDGKIDSMKAEGTILEMKLDRLSRDDSIGMIHELYRNNDFGEDFIGELLAATAGNPFFLKELLRHMLTEGHIRAIGDTFMLERKDYALPATVEEVVKLRLDTLSVNAMALAEYASCAGRKFHADALSGCPVPEPGSAMDELAGSEILVRIGGYVEFAHALYRDFIYGSLTPRWKALHHGSIGESLEGAYAGNPEEIAYDLAHHFALGNRPEKALRYCMVAGEMAENSFAAEQAARFYRDALASLKKVRKDEDMEFMISERIGDALSLAGNLDEAREQYESLVSAARIPESVARIRRKLAGVHEKLGDYRKAIETATCGLDDVGTDNVEHWRLVLTAANANMRMGNYPESITGCEKALAFLGSGEAHRKDLAQAYGIIGVCLWYTGDLDRALAIFEEGMKIKKDVGDRLGQAQFHNNMGLVHRTRAELDKARTHLRSGLDIVNELGYQYGIAMLTTNLAIVAFDLGDFDLALDLYNKSLTLNESMGDRGGIASSYANIGVIYNDMSEYAIALDYFEKSRDIQTEINDQWGLASLHMNVGNALQMMGEPEQALEEYRLAQEQKEKLGDQVGVASTMFNIGSIEQKFGRLDAAEDCFNKSLDICRKIGNRDMLIRALLGLVEIGILRGKAHEMLESMDEAVKLSQDSGMLDKMAKCNRTRGLLLQARGDSDGAIRCLAESSEIYRKMKMAGESAISALELGKALAGAGRADEAGRFIRGALELFESKGMKGFAAEARNALAALGA